MGTLMHQARMQFKKKTDEAGPAVPSVHGGAGKLFDGAELWPSLFPLALNVNVASVFFVFFCNGSVASVCHAKE